MSGLRYGQHPEHRRVGGSGMKRWTDIVLVSSAAAVALAQWFVPGAAEELLGLLLFGLVVLTVLSQRHATGSTLDSLTTAHKEQLESERRYRALFDACSDVILVHRFDEHGRPGHIVEVNEAACLALGYARSQLLSMTAEDVLAPEARGQVRERAQVLADAGTLAYETVQITSDRQRLPVEVTARIVDIGGRRLCLTVSHSIAAHKELEEFLRGLTDVDELTGRLNRRGFFVRVDEIRRKARRGDRQVRSRTSTWTASSGSTTSEGTPRATSCWWRRQTCSAPRSVMRMWWLDSAATSSWRWRCSAAVTTSTWTGRRSPRASSRRCRPNARSSARPSTSRSAGIDGRQPPRAVQHRRLAGPRRRADVRGEARPQPQTRRRLSAPA